MFITLSIQTLKSKKCFFLFWYFEIKFILKNIIIDKYKTIIKLLISI